MKSIKCLISIFILILLTGCAHPIVITPDISKISADASSQQIGKNAGYYISPENRELAVTSSGGGGDKVTYYPYKEIETAFYKMLSNVFKDVIVLSKANDTETIKKRAISYVFIPSITTTSYSSSPFTWPPTWFTVNFTCNILDNAGATLTSKSVTGEGRAEFDEFKSDPSLSAKRATQDALLKMQTILLTSPELKK